MEGDVSGARTGRCTTPESLQDFAKSPQWTGWSPATTNTRFQPADQAGLSASDLPRLKLKWAFGFPDASVAWSHPTVAGGRLFVGSQNGTVYSLDAKTGCIHWTFSAAGGVRTAIGRGAGRRLASRRVLRRHRGQRLRPRCGDRTPTVDAARRRSPVARITGSPTFFEGRLYVPVSSYEEAQGADPQYPCCTFRGSISALDAESGAVDWKTYMIAEPPQRRGTSTAGVPLWGPSGAGIWSAPTVDAARRALYVATGNAYSAPRTSSSDAVVALDLATGAIRWTRQVTPNDVYVYQLPRRQSQLPGVTRSRSRLRQPAGAGACGWPGRPRDRAEVGHGVRDGSREERRGDLAVSRRAGQCRLAASSGARPSTASMRTSPCRTSCTAQPGGLHAVNLATGTRAWFTAPPIPTCRADRGSGRGCNGAQSAAVTAIPGVVFSGSNDGALRAYSTTTGAMLWEFDTQSRLHDRQRRARQGRLDDWPGPGRRRWYGVRELWIRRVRRQTRQRVAGLWPGVAHET